MSSSKLTEPLELWWKFYLLVICNTVIYCLCKTTWEKSINVLRLFLDLRGPRQKLLIPFMAWLLINFLKIMSSKALWCHSFRHLKLSLTAKSGKINELASFRKVVITLSGKNTDTCTFATKTAIMKMWHFFGDYKVKFLCLTPLMSTAFPKNYRFTAFQWKRMGGSRGGGTGGSNPLKNHKNIGFLRNTGPEPLKNHKATKPAFNFGPLSALQPFQWCFSGGAMMAPFWWYLVGLSLPSKKNKT